MSNNISANQKLLKGFAERLKAARMSSHFETATEFAVRLDIAPATYRKYERGGACPTIETLEKISVITNQTLDWLLLGRKSN